MRVRILEVAGVDHALLGLSLSYGHGWNEETREKMVRVASRLDGKGGGHDKFLESVIVWLDIKAPRYWWSEFDTYRVGVTKQSESTMHTIKKRLLTQDDFSRLMPPGAISHVNNAIANGESVQAIKELLPEAFLQRRIVCLSLKALDHIISQRKDHRLQAWKDFCSLTSHFLWGRIPWR